MTPRPTVRPSAGPVHAVLGLSALAHDPAACLFVDGRLVAAVEEERLNREKRTRAFPHLAIEAVLREGGLTFSDVDRVAYYWDDRGQLPATLAHDVLQFPRSPAGIARLVPQHLRAYRGPRLLERELSAHCGGDPAAVPPIAYVDHHLAHLAAARFSAPFEPDAGLIVDGRGEYAATSLYDLSKAGGRGGVRLVDRYPFPNSLGVFYGAVTQCLGYRALADEYKVMGLASYGSPDDRLRDEIHRLLAISETGSYQLDVRSVRPERCSTGDDGWFASSARERLDGPFRDEDGLTDKAKSLALEAQRRLEEAILALVARLVRKTGARRLVMAGGVAMNAAAIGRLRAADLVEELHVPLAPTDAGAAVGAALAALDRAGVALPDPESLADPFLGPRYSTGDLEAALATSGAAYRPCGDPARRAAEDLARGCVVGWFDGRMEFGERALGARSILGDPRQPSTRDRINASVKYREAYRPFAPSVLEERASTYFDVTSSRRMGEIVRAREAARGAAPAIVHVDGTARPQTVPPGWPAASFRRLIEHFDDLTGVPMVLNTSFNMQHEPIVCSPGDALRCYAESGLDVLYLGPFRLEKNHH
jgi:carbamoyltransferase